MKGTTKIEVMLNDATELKRIMYSGGFEMPALMHEIINYGISGFLGGRNPAVCNNYDLSRFESAHGQDIDGYADALQQMRAGKKTGHWMWYIFPQIKGLGESENSQKYALAGVDEARAFLFDHTLGRHLLEIVDAILAHRGKKIESIMVTNVDVKKLRSSMTLFEIADPSEKRFGKVLDRFFKGKRDGKTLKLLKNISTQN